MVDGIQELVQALQTDTAEPSKTYHAEVSHIDSDGTVWVYLEGATKETPTAMSSSEVAVGDNVNVEWRNNKLYITGNVSSPSAGTIRVRAVEQAIQIAIQAAQSKFSKLIVDADGIRTEVGKKVGNDEVISRINQSAESISIEADKIEFVTSVDNGDGIKVHTPNDATNNYLLIDPDGMGIYKGGDSVALYGATQRIGKSAAQHIELDDDSFEWHDGTNGAFFSIEGSIGSGGSSVSLHSPTIWTYIDHEEPSAGIRMSHNGDYGYMKISASCKANSATDASIYIGANRYNTSHGEGEGAQLHLTPYNLAYEIFTDGGLLNYFNINGSKITAPARTLTTLWSGANMLGAGNVVNLSGRISDQLNGIVLVWSAYSSGAARDQAWVYHFIPKHGATGNQSTTVFMANGDFSQIGAKFLFIYDSYINGYSSNNATGTRNGITYNNAYWVLRYVYGV